VPCSAVSSYYCRYNELIFRVHLTMLEASAWLLLSMSVCLSVCQMHALWQNEILQVCQYHTIERCCWVLPPLVLWTHHTGIEATALVVPWPPATSALQADDSCTGHYRWRLPTSGRLWLMDTTVFWTLSLYCITLQQHVWPTFVERLAQRSLQHQTFNSTFGKNEMNATVFLLHEAAVHLWQFKFYVPFINALTYLLLQLATAVINLLQCNSTNFRIARLNMHRSSWMRPSWSP